MTCLERNIFHIHSVGMELSTYSVPGIYLVLLKPFVLDRPKEVGDFRG